jgi:uncharacterized protein with GYD domain
MPTYIGLLKYTQQGAAHIKESPARLDAARKAGQAMGVQIKEWYLVMGQYDAVVVIEASNDEAVAKILLVIGALGNVQTETFRAFKEDEFRNLIAGLP